MLKDAWVNYRDESFIQQFLSPKVMRDPRLFAVTKIEQEDWYTVSAIHYEAGYRQVRDALQRVTDPTLLEPVI